MGELERVKAALDYAVRALGAASLSMKTDDLAAAAKRDIDRVNAILNPPAEFETVEVERRECDQCGKIQHVDPCNGLCPCFTMGHNPSMWQWIKLTGTFRRPKPVKAERSVSVVATIGAREAQHMPGACRFAADENKAAFTYQPECHGKTGTLTFTWQE